MAVSDARLFMKYFLFMFIFIISFILIGIKKIEIFGVSLFLFVNIIFCILLGKELTDGTISYSEIDIERNIKFWVLFVSVVFSLVSSIMMAMTIFTLQSKFAANKSEIQWSPTDRLNMDNMEILFITVTTFIGVSALYVYNSAEDVRKLTYSTFNSILNGGEIESMFRGSFGDWLRLLFPIVTIGVGSALYGRLQMPPLEVNKTPDQVICDPANDSAIQQFKDSFIKTYWILFAYVIVVVSRPFIEANFNIFGVSPSMLVGFTPGDRSFVFGQNPAISLLSLLTFGISNLVGINDVLKTGESNTSYFKYLAFVLVGILVWLGIIFGFGNMINLDKTALYSVIGICTLILVGYIGLYGLYFKKSLPTVLLAPILRWDVLYLLMKYAFGLTGLVFAGFTIRDFQNIPADDACLFRDTHIRQLYIAFIFFLIMYYTFYTLSASNLTSLVTNIMRYLVPPALLGMTSYLVFLTNYFVKLSPQLVVN